MRGSRRTPHLLEGGYTRGVCTLVLYSKLMNTIWIGVMKRYDIHFDDKDELIDYEDPEGEWVLWMDVYTLLARQGICVKGFESQDVNPVE